MPLRWNPEEFVALCKQGGMARLVEAAMLVRDEAKRILWSKQGNKAITRVPGRYYQIVGGKRVPSTNPPVWMERTPGAMVRTIRVVLPYGARGTVNNVWIMAGNRKTWWAIQAEYGRGGWKGGSKAFLRPALKRAEAKMKTIIENGTG